MAASAGQLTVAERGKAAEYSIVVPEKASPSQKYAAEELRDFTEKATGVRLLGGARNALRRIRVT